MVGQPQAGIQVFPPFFLLLPLHSQRCRSFLRGRCFIVLFIRFLNLSHSFYNPKF